MTSYRAAVKWPIEAPRAEIRRVVFTEVPIMVAELLDTEVLTLSDVERLCDELLADAEDRP